MPYLYVLTTAGARRLALSGHGVAGHLDRVVATVAKRRTDIEAGNPSHIRHALDVTHLACHLLRAVVECDATATVRDVHYDRELTCYLAARDVLDRLPEVEHEHLRRTKDEAQTAWVPDFLCTVTWSLGGDGPSTTAFALEVETGFGETPPRRIGVHKAAKVGVVERDLARTRRIGPIGLPNGGSLTTLVWTTTPAGEVGLVEGIRSVQRAEKNHLLTTNGDLLPLAPPRGTAKKDLPTALRGIRHRLLGEAIWQPVVGPERRAIAPGRLAPAAAPSGGEE